MPTRVVTRSFGTMPDGAPVAAYALSSAHLHVEIIEFGAIVVRLSAPDRRGDPGDVVLGFDDLEDYLADTSHFGGVVGRFANRIARGRFSLDGAVYALTINDPPNHLHGGDRGFDQRLWHGAVTANGVVLRLTSPDGEEGYPGELHAEVRYALEDARLDVYYAATTNRATVVNLSQHSYFDLACDGAILDHELTIDADFYTPIDDTLIPTGEILRVDATPFDFRTGKPIGADIEASHRQLAFGSGYDHNFVLSGALGRDGLRRAAMLYAPASGRELTVRTDQPGLQFYSGNFLDGSAHGKSGRRYAHRDGLCLETQHFPNSPNVAHFPSTVLRPGERFETRTAFEFRVRS